VLDKINANYTYLDVTNYWTPLETIKEEDDTEQEHINNIEMKIQETTKRTGNKWTRRAEERKKKQRKHMIIINSGATSHFMS
jgi:hypothetical protein